MPEIPTPESPTLPADGIDRLSRVFHEPRRLAIMSVLCASAPTGLSFSELRAQCGLTDGNLNRHLKTLEEAGAITRQRTQRGSGPPALHPTPGNPTRPRTLSRLPPSFGRSLTTSKRSRKNGANSHWIAGPAPCNRSCLMPRNSFSIFNFFRKN